MWGLAAFLAAFAGAANGAFAQNHAAKEAASPFSLEYAATGKGCLSREQMLQAVAQRAPHHVEASSARAERQFRIRIKQQGASSIGTLEQPAVGSVRDVSASDCRRVAEALALVLAMSLETTPRAEPAAGPAQPATNPSTPIKTLENRASAPVQPLPNEQRRGAIQSETVPRMPPPPLGWSLGLGAFASTGVSRRILVGPEVAAEWAHEAGWLFARLSARHGWGAGLPRERVTEASPALGLRMPGRWEPGVQIGLAAGALALDEQRPQLSVVAGAGPSLRMRLGSSEWLELRGELGVPLVRRSSAASGGVPAFETPAVVGGLTLLAGTGGISTAERISTAATGHSQTR
jgi:hypothetical protein